ncbi:MAG: Riboflavin transporter [Alphaproteobacteria bacterium MarineAlpha5_Bin5]|nr:MAG: Riboflavin transporter [Alphaproteobacteria bacterium MarineAlpha5_Bin5]PPR51695.1 MAG: Riboflavin transporter [Alphaproteobacteria bacterium MarineAlpha5_Bin4]|tara:strand:+ start:1468 stop:2331 length:864 start_codon:yes stop_codon:yes gene_type:complete
MFNIKSIESVGILFAIAAYLSFSLLDVMQKTAVIYHSIFQLLFIKYFFTLFLSYLESRRKKNYTFYRSKNFKLQFLRSILSLLESACFVLAFRYLSLANAHSIGALTPVIVVALSSIILREYVSLRTWFAIFIGFVGVLIIMRPGLSIFDSKSLIPLGAAFLLSFYQIITRKVSEFDSTETSLFYTSVIGIFLMSFFAYFFWQPLQTFSYLLFFGIGIFFSMGIYFQIIALSKARASIVQPFHYTLIFWAIILGYIFYKDFPDIFTLIGASIITISGIYVLKNSFRN